MNPEQEPPQELTQDQMDIANDLIELCDLQEHADKKLVMFNQSGTVRYGLGRCAAYLMCSTPDEIQSLVLAKLEQQEQLGKDSA